MQHYIYGAGGHGKVVLDAMQLAGIDCAGFLDDGDVTTWANLNVYRLANIELSAHLHLAIGSCKTRESISLQLNHLTFFTVIHPSSVIAKTAKIGQGTLLAAQCVVAPDAKVGDQCIINHAAVVDHDCIVGHYSHIAPHATLSGAVVVGKGVLIGAGVVVLPGVTIGDYAVVGAGAVVTRNVSAGETVAGNPAKTLK